MYFATLKTRQRAERHNYSEGLALRVHRALSWLERAEKSDDDDARFIFLWISFNAAYAQDIDENRRIGEQEAFKLFLEKICDLDKEKRFGKLIWQEFSGSIRVMLDNHYLLQAFWEHQRDTISKEQWQEQLRKEKQIAQFALGCGNTAILLGVLFTRLYTLRNQLIHGGATWNSQVNRQQLKDCVSLLHKFVPLLIETIMDNPNTLWGEACYPVVG